jgi:hypothetical protein
MLQNWVGYVWPLTSLVGTLAIACYMKQQGNRMHKALRDIRESQIDLLEQIESLTQTELPSLSSDEDAHNETARTASTEIPERPTRGEVSHAEAELISKVQAAVRSEDYLPLRDNSR